MSRAPLLGCSLASGMQQPNADTPVRKTSMGWLAAGSCSSTVATAAGKYPQCLQFDFVGGQLRPIRQFFVHQEVRDLFEFALGGDVENVVAAVVQIIAGGADGTERSVARRHSGQGHGLLGFERARGGLACPSFLLPRCEQLVQLGFVRVIVEILV